MDTVRYRTILEMVIRQYIQSAVPVGSRAVSRDSGLNLSAATIRNIMADLEEMGFLMQPHTSAGRMPTEKGYRYYVDTLMEIQRITQEEQTRIRGELETRQRELTEVLRVTTQLLSALTHTPSMITAPLHTSARLRHLELIRLTDTRLLAVLIYDDGVVENLPLEPATAGWSAELEHAANLINQHGRDRTLAELAAAVEPALAALPDGALRQLAAELAAELPQRAAQRGTEVRVDGASLLVGQPDFKDLATVKEMLRALENRAALAELLRDGIGADHPVVRIGSENPADLRECAVITRRYEIGGRPAGALGIVGPTRLEYSRAVGIIDYLARAVSELLSEPGRD